MLIHWIWLSRLPQLTLRQKISLLEQFRDPEDIFRASEDVFFQVENLTEKMLDSLGNKDLTESRNILTACNEKNISILTYGDGAYPSKLKNIENPPLVLYYKGFLPDWEQVPVIGIVGTRKASAYGLQMAERMGQQIAASGSLVVSGGAGGIDTQALWGAIQSGKKVVAVSGCGADVVYPAKNKELYAQIEKQGCVLTEFIPGTPPHAWNFPQRNRIISGLSNGVVIMEAPERSGALNTASHAADQGRDIFVVPGNADNPNCAGSNQLLRERAIPVFSGWDVVREYASLYPDTLSQSEAQEKTLLKVAQERSWDTNVEKAAKKVIDNREKSQYSVEEKENIPLSEEEKAVYACLTENPKPVDEVIAALELPAGKVLSVLTILAMKGLVKNHPGKRISK